MNGGDFLGLALILVIIGTVLGCTIYLANKSYLRWLHGNKGLDLHSKEVECPNCHRLTKRQKSAQECSHCYTSF
jgi:hypothetical protein